MFLVLKEEKRCKRASVSNAGHKVVANSKKCAEPISSSNYVHTTSIMNISYLCLKNC